MKVKDARKNIKAAPAVKAELGSVQAELKFKTESLALAYLTALYRMQRQRITLAEHQKLMQAAEEANNQASL